MDSGSGVKATFMNPDMVHNIRPTSNPINMTTNAGNTLLDTVATVPGWGEVHFHKDGMANIFGLYHMTLKYRVTFDSKKENAFLVHTPNGIIKFKCTEEGLHAFNLSIGHCEEIAIAKANDPTNE